ncbi:MAG: PilZ domain-containing protein [Vicinamibacterales bacterium]
MDNQLNNKGDLARRRYPRVAGPFPGSHIGDHESPVLVYDLNRGGGFINFLDRQPDASTLLIKIDLPEGPITVNAETVYRHPSGVAVRFVDVDDDSGTRLARTVGTLCWGN